MNKYNACIFKLLHQQSVIKMSIQYDILYHIKIFFFFSHVEEKKLLQRNKINTKRQTDVFTENINNNNDNGSDRTFIVILF